MDPYEVVPQCVIPQEKFGNGFYGFGLVVLRSYGQINPDLWTVI